MKGLRGLVLLAVRRATATPQLLAIRFAGLLVAVILVAGVTLYGGAMGDAMLQQRVGLDATNTNFAVSLSGQALSGAQYGRLDSYIRQGESADVGLPLGNLHVHHNTSTVRVFRLPGRGTAINGAPLASLALDYYQGLMSQVSVYGGPANLPDRMPDGDAPVLISPETARSLHLQPGDRLAFGESFTHAVTPPLVVAGIFLPNDINSAFWDIHAGDRGYESLVTPSLQVFQTFAADASLFSPDYYWQSSTSVGAIHLGSANAIVAGIGRARARMSAIAPGTTLITSLDVAIGGFQDQYQLLSQILLILVAPVLALILFAIFVTTNLALERQAGEIVLMRSRGATSGQVFALYAGEGVALGIAGLAVGPFLGLPLARVIGRSSGFLTFGGALQFDLALQPETYLYCGATVVLAILVGLLPAMSLARRSMMSFKREQSRPSRRPLWQRLYLDFVVLAASLYGLYLLVGQGTVSSSDVTAVVAKDPVIGLAPLLFAVAITMMLARVAPRVAALLLYLLGRFTSPSAYVALHSLTRAPKQPMRLMQLCTLTLTLGIFAATVAGVQEQNLSDQYLYQAGAPLRLRETFDRQGLPVNQQNVPDAMPISAHLALPGVHAATPALRFESFGNVINTTDNSTAVNVLGVDPATAASVMWYRSDFADQPFGRLLQSIASDGPSAVVSDNLLSATGMHTGDTFGVTLTNNTRVSFHIVGTAHFFPSLDPTQYPFVVCNLAYLSAASKSHGANEMWLETDQTESAINTILIAVGQWPRTILSYDGLPPADAAQGNPLSTGIYGVVSVGFLIAVALVLLGFGTYGYLTLQQRLTEVAILRALGLSQGQVRSLLLFEQVFLVAAAIAGGIAAGLLTTQLFLPYLPVATSVVPPFVVVMPWLAVGEFVLALLVVFVLVLSVHMTVLLRAQLSRVLRLGEG